MTRLIPNTISAEDSETPHFRQSMFASTPFRAIHHPAAYRCTRRNTPTNSIPTAICPWRKYSSGNITIQAYDVPSGATPASHVHRR